MSCILNLICVKTIDCNNLVISSPYVANVQGVLTKSRETSLLNQPFLFFYAVGNK